MAKSKQKTEDWRTDPFSIKIIIIHLSDCNSANYVAQSAMYSIWRYHDMHSEKGGFYYDMQFRYKTHIYVCFSAFNFQVLLGNFHLSCETKAKIKTFSVNIFR